MGCELGNMSFTDKVKLLHEQISKLDYTQFVKLLAGSADLQQLFLKIDNFNLKEYELTDEDRALMDVVRDKLDFTSENFSGNLTPTDNTLQKVLDTLDDLPLNSLTPQEWQEAINKIGLYPYVDDTDTTQFTVYEHATHYIAKGRQKDTYYITIPTNHEYKILFLRGDRKDSTYIWRREDGTIIETTKGQNGIIVFNDNGTWRILENTPYAKSEANVIDMNYENIYRTEEEYVISTIKGFIQTGQSLAEGGVGNDEVPGLIPYQYPDRSFMFFPQPIGRYNTLTSRIVSLKEDERVTVFSSMMRHEIEDNDNLFTLSHGQAQGGKTYAELKKGGSTGVYEKIITQVQNAKDKFPSITYDVITIEHGEADGLINNNSYDANLAQWISDFNSDIKAITGQNNDIFMITSQISSAGNYGYNGGITEEDCKSGLLQLKAHENNTNIFVSNPNYFLPNYDHAHLLNRGQVWLGEYFYKAYKSIKETGIYEPLRPSSISHSNNKITIDFVGRVGNLVFDEVNVLPIENKGFQYIDDAGNTITDVQIVNNKIEITLSGDVGANPKISYAYHNLEDGKKGEASHGYKDRGNLRDSDTTQSLYGFGNLYNWCVVFRKDVLTGETI